MRVQRPIPGILLALASCSSPTSPAMIERETPPNLRSATPPAQLAGTSQPGDVYSIAISGSTFTVRNDRGTPGMLTDDVVLSGDVTGRDGASPFSLVVRNSSDRTAHPIGSTLRALAMPGFGYVLQTTSAVITAIEPVQCADMPRVLQGWTNNAVSAFVQTGAQLVDVAPGIFWEARRPLVMRGDLTLVQMGPWSIGDLSFSDPSNPAPESAWNARFAPCVTGEAKVALAAARNVFSAPVANSPYHFRALDPAQGALYFTKGGVLFVDFGLGFGAVAMSVLRPSGTNSQRVERLRLRMRSRTLVGYLSNYSQFQPAGADRENPEIERRSLSRTLAVRIDTMETGAQWQFSSVDGTAIGSPIAASVQIESDGSLSIGAGHVANDLAFRGVTIDNAEGSSFILSAQDRRSEGPSAQPPTDFESAASIPPPAGMELFRRSYTLHLRMSTPHDCFATSTTLPAEYRDNVARPVPSISQPTLNILSVVFGGSAPTVTLRSWSDAAHSGMPVVRQLSSEPRYAVIAPSTPVELSTAAGSRVRLLCGPDYPWLPGADVFGAVEGAQSGAMGNLGFVVPGVYVIESSAAGSAPGAQSQYYVIEVKQPPT